MTKMSDYMSSHSFWDIYDEISTKMQEVEDERIFNEKKEDGTINGDFCLLMNPKYKGQMYEMRAAGLKVPVVWSRLVEEDKAYVVTDKEIVKNARGMYQ